jgi:hypothetical protein
VVGRRPQIGFGNLAKEHGLSGSVTQSINQMTGFRGLNLDSSGASEDENSNNKMFHQKAPLLNWRTALRGL